MPEYVYRREDGTTFNLKQKFKDDALTIDPQTGQRVIRLIQNTGIIFKGSGFYVNDSKKASKRNLNGNGNGSSSNGSSENGSSSSNGSSNNDSSGNKSSADSEKVKDKKKSDTVTKNNVKGSKVESHQ